MPAEQWKPIPRFPGYAASSEGRILSWMRGAPRILRQHPLDKERPYLTVWMTDGKKLARRRVHVIVASAFLGPRGEGQVIRHLNGRASDNRVSNLAYGSASDNVRDAVLHGTHAMTRKTHCPQGHPYIDENTYVDREGKRKCRTCRRAWSAAYYQRSKQVAA